MAELPATDPFEELRVGFTAAVSHELRTPLARLLALLDSASLPSADTEALVEQAKQEVESMAELVDDVLFLSELETGRAVVGLGDVPVAPIVRDVVEGLGASAERHAQEIVTLVAEDVVVAVRPRILRVLLENLVTNAIRYAGDGARCTISARTEGDMVLLSVADNGPGVPNEELARLFERFFRGDRARTTRGTGLGLAIVKHVVTQAGGEVEARRGPGGIGLEIRCTFPR
ncbi:MAG TPA: HAMP domain-containing sensor histidine kinase [Gaiellaceae bacterium]|nr:HAMP domain-containing sensor histidine kinase [Gaiellaceae bacterium]